MAKRRVVGSGTSDEEEEKSVKETKAQRQARREQEARAKTKRAHRHEGFLSGRPTWQVYGIVIGAGAAVIALVAAVIVLGFSGPCLTLSSPPASSGTPDENNPSWCSNSTNWVYHIYVKVEIVIGGSFVTIPGGVGEQVTPHRYGFDCTMPVFTDNSTGSGNSGGIVQIGSDWSFTYTLGEFFSLWQESDTNAQVNGQSVGIQYTGTEIFNYSDSKSQVTTLLVDGQPNSAGPNLVISSLPNYPASSSQPGCLVNQYGANHVIEIVWGWRGATLAVPVLTPPGGTAHIPPSLVDPGNKVASPHTLELAGSTLPSRTR